MDILYEDFHKMVVARIVKDKVYKILIVMSRLDNEVFD